MLGSTCCCSCSMVILYVTVQGEYMALIARRAPRAYSAQYTASCLCTCNLYIARNILRYCTKAASIQEAFNHVTQQGMTIKPKQGVTADLCLPHTNKTG